MSITYWTLAMIFTFLSIDLFAQTVINTEALRLQEEEGKFKGLLDASFGMTRNKAGLSINPEIDLRGEWNFEQTRWIALGGYELNRFTDLNLDGSGARNFTNRSFAHLRYNRSLSKVVTWEVFSQTQHDEIQEIDLRTLLGTGLRLTLVEEEIGYLYLGGAYMFEYEASSSIDIRKIYERNNRVSTYVSLGFRFNESVNISHTTYFQPNLEAFDDHRFSSITDIKAAIIGGFGMQISFEILYDSRPPITVPNTMYDFDFGLILNF